MNNAIFATMKYTTLKNKKIDVFFFDKENAWFKESDVEILFNFKLSDDVIKNISENNAEYLKLIPNYGFLLHWEVIKAIGGSKNADEYNNLSEWVKIVTDKHDPKISEEFINALKNLIN